MFEFDLVPMVDSIVGKLRVNCSRLCFLEK